MKYFLEPCISGADKVGLFFDTDKAKHILTTPWKELGGDTAHWYYDEQCKEMYRVKKNRQDIFVFVQRRRRKKLFRKGYHVTDLNGKPCVYVRDTKRAALEAIAWYYSVEKLEEIA